LPDSPSPVVGCLIFQELAEFSGQNLDEIEAHDAGDVEISFELSAHRGGAVQCNFHFQKDNTSDPVSSFDLPRDRM
jgi:hypothetical protein